MWGKKKPKEEPKPRSSIDSKISNFERLSTSSSTFVQSSTTTITERKIFTQTTKTSTNKEVKPYFNTFSGTCSTDKSTPKPDAYTIFNNPSSSIPNKPINLNYQSPYRTSAHNNGGARSSFFSTTKPDAIPINNTIPPRKSSVPAAVVPHSSNYSNKQYLHPLNSSSSPSPSASTKSLPDLQDKLVVKKTGKKYDSASLIPVYSTQSKKRGEVLIINNIHFPGKDERAGAKSDDTNLKTVFKQLNFAITAERDLRGAQMESKIKQFSKNKSLKSVDIVVVIIMSHGTNRLHVSGTEIYGIDDQALSTDTILDFFTAENCPHLAGKPKIFIFQCCRSFEDFHKTDAVPFKQPIGHSDMLIAFSTLPGFVSYRDPKTGTWYIQTLCQVLCNHAHEYHIEELLKIVDNQIVKASGLNQVTTYESRGFKRCYFHP